MNLESTGNGEIHAWASSIDQWQEAATGILTEGWDMESEIELHTQRLVGLVLSNTVSVGELRGGVTWASALDREAVHMYGSDTREGECTYERTARRIMHLAGRGALNQVKNYRKLSTLRVRNKV